MSETRWLKPAEADAWQQLLALVEYLPAAIDTQLKHDSDLGRFEYSVLAMLSTADARTLPMLDLSLVTFGSLSRLSHTITRLDQRGFVTRQRQGANRYVTLTEAGMRAVVDAAPNHVNEVRRQVFDHLSPGRASDLADILRPVADYLKDCAPRS